MQIFFLENTVRKSIVLVVWSQVEKEEEKEERKEETDKQINRKTDRETFNKDPREMYEAGCTNQLNRFMFLKSLTVFCAETHS